MIDPLAITTVVMVGVVAYQQYRYTVAKRNAQELADESLKLVDAYYKLLQRFQTAEMLLSMYDYEKEERLNNE